MHGVAVGVLLMSIISCTPAAPARTNNHAHFVRRPVRPAVLIDHRQPRRTAMHGYPLLILLGAVLVTTGQYVGVNSVVYSVPYFYTLHTS